MSTTLRLAHDFMTALDANDAEAVRATLAADATWWVDTGLDRLAGRFGTDPGDDRPWPLHGEMSAREKCDLLRGLPERFPGGCRQLVTRSFAGGDVAVLEVAGDGMFLGTRPYRNRYCFVITVADGSISSVREYLDTRHSATVFDGRHLDRRTTLPGLPELPAPTATSPEGQTALELLRAIDGADQELFDSLFTPEATWWADGGSDRRWSDPDGPAEADPELLVVGKVRVAQRGRRIGDLAAAYRGGLRIAAHRLVEDDAGSGLVAVEAASHGIRAGNGAVYQNRYAFVLRVTPAGLIDEVREYCDTHHAFDAYELPL